MSRETYRCEHCFHSSRFNYNILMMKKSFTQPPSVVSNSSTAQIGVEQWPQTHLILTLSSRIMLRNPLNSTIICAALSRPAFRTLCYFRTGNFLPIPLSVYLFCEKGVTLKMRLTNLSIYAFSSNSSFVFAPCYRVPTEITLTFNLTQFRSAFLVL